MAEQNEDDVLSVIAQIISEGSGATTKDITHETASIQDLDVDPLGLLTIATQAEGRLSVTLGSSLIPTLPTVEMLIDLMTSRKA